MKVDICGEALILDHRKAIYWSAQKALLLSDLHIGKAGHFRKHGIAIHNNVNRGTLWNLSALIADFEPKDVLILGDLTHDARNGEWEQFVDFVQMFPEISWKLINGNHDRLSAEDYENAGIKCYDQLDLGPFKLLHEFDETATSERYIISGHLHPAVRLKGKGRQNVKLSCFFFGESAGILPAFGEFTGRHVLQVEENDRVFAIAGNEVLPIDSSKLLR